MVDLTGVAVAATGGFFSILATVITVWLQSRMKDKDASAALSSAIQNSLGALQQAATSEIQTVRPQIPGVPASLAPAVQYVIDHAGDEATRLGVTPASIATKVEAKIGLQNIATNLAISGSDLPVVAHPLDPVPPAPPAVIQ